MKPLVILTGPTAVGKTAMSIELAKRIGGEIISADSVQVYKGMDIGTAKITPGEMCGVPHHLIAILEPDEEFNVYRFKELASAAMEKIYENGHIPIITGGTGFYIQSVLYDIDFTEESPDTGIREELQKIADEKGAEYLHGMLSEIDSESAAAIHANNVKRVIRAIEYYRQTGQKMSEHNSEQRSKDSPYNFAYLVLNDDRRLIYERIDSRVDKMLADGLLDEVKALMDAGYDRNLVSMQGLGYKEIISYFNGEMSLDEAVYVLKRDTRHFAKRQLTWFGRERDVDFIRLDELRKKHPDNIKAAALDEMLQILGNKGIADGKGD